MPKRLTVTDYKNAGDEKGLDFIGEIDNEYTLKRLSQEFDYHICGESPRSSLTSTHWRCRLTGVIVKKRIGSVQRSTYGSRYQREFLGEGGTLSRYTSLADKLGIVFLYDPQKEFFPATTKTLCRWLGRNNKVSFVSYHNLGYSIITYDTMAKLGLSEDDVREHFAIDGR